MSTVFQLNFFIYFISTVFQSAAYFYEVGECITNVADSVDHPDVFLNEDKDRVVYFDNGCTADTFGWFVDR